MARMSLPTLPNTSTILNSLRTFAASTAKFQILHSIPATATNPTSPTPKTLYILDSSFNPPTTAHLRICTSALRNDTQAASDGSRRLLLLLAMQNADKAPKPAAFEQRLGMMCIFAEEVQASYHAHIKEDGAKDQDEETEEVIPIDVGVTKLPMFVDKVTEITSSGAYGDGEGMEQVHLVGFDTLTRLLDSRYYPPSHTLRPLETLFGRHRVRVTRRSGDQWGEREEQEGYVKALGAGEREEEGARREWAERIELVEGRDEGEEAVSSTKIREMVGRRKGVGNMVTRGVEEWIEREGLYKEDG